MQLDIRGFLAAFSLHFACSRGATDAIWLADAQAAALTALLISLFSHFFAPAQPMTCQAQSWLFLQTQRHSQFARRRDGASPGWVRQLYLHAPSTAWSATPPDDDRRTLPSSDLTKFGTEFRVNTTIPGAGVRVEAKALADGRFIAAFADFGTGDVRACLFHADGSEQRTTSS